MKIKEYIEDLLEIVASECNVKEVIGIFQEEKSVFLFDTIRGKKIGIDDNYQFFSLIFSGNISEDMQTVRKMCSYGLEQRNNAKIKVRYPLQNIKIYINQN